MAINVSFGKLVKDVKGVNHIVKKKRLLKLPKEYDFGFDIYEPNNWRVWLENYKDKNGKLLPRKTVDGEQIVYDIRLYGVTVKIRGELGITGRIGYLNLFPGYSDFDKRIFKKTEIHGRLR
jgi:hypothetical protein